jgi:lanosterol synthase
MLTAQYVMTAYMTGQTIPKKRRERFLKFFAVWQTPDGGWGMHAESPAYVFVTVMVYLALRILGLDRRNPMCRKARVWLRNHGGVLHVPTWGKAWLSMMNLFHWEGVAPVLPELWLLPQWAPVHPRRMYCHTRQIYLGIGYLYGVRFQIEPTDLVYELREELFETPFHRIDFAKHRYDLAPTDTFEPPHPLLKGAYELCRFYDRFHSKSRRKRALDLALDHIVHHQRESRFAAISPVNGLLNTLALFHAGHPDFEPSWLGVDYWAWTDEPEGERFNGAHSHTWDTSFAVQAVCDGPLATEFEAFLSGASRYLKNAQMTSDVPQGPRYHRDPRMGGFCFSDQHHHWPVSDCTGEALAAISVLADHVEDEVFPGPEQIVNAVRFVLTRQNGDGGFGSYERNRGGRILDRFNPSEMFGNCMVERSYVECTASCIHGLRRALTGFGELFADEERERIEASIAKGAMTLRRCQARDGSWPGFWGVNQIYGTLFGITGLLSANATCSDPAIRRACDWLVRARLPDGGWGESYRGCVEERYFPHSSSQVIMTSWALMALMRAGYDGPGVQEAISSGARLLMNRQLPDGDWPKEGVGGVFFNTAMHHYCLYKNYFPLWALGLYSNSIG